MFDLVNLNMLRYESVSTHPRRKSNDNRVHDLWIFCVFQYREGY